MAFTDIMVLGVYLLAIAIFFVSFALLTQQITAIPMMNQTFNYTINGTAMQSRPVGTLESLSRAFDWFFVLMAFSLALVILVTNYFVPAHPIYGFFSIFISIAWIFVAPYLSNAWEWFASISVVSGVIPNYPLISAFFAFLPAIGLILGQLGNALLYGKNPQQSGFGR